MAGKVFQKSLRKSEGHVLLIRTANFLLTILNIIFHASHKLSITQVYLILLIGTMNA